MLALLTVVAQPAPADHVTDGCPGVHVFFDPGSARIDRVGVYNLDRGLIWLRPMLEAGAWLNLEAATDDIGPAAYNMRLSRRRAEAVRAFLVTRGIRAGQLRIVALGETRQLSPYPEDASPELARAQNRYVNAWPEMPIAVFRRFFPPGGLIC